MCCPSPLILQDVKLPDLQNKRDEHCEVCVPDSHQKQIVEAVEETGALFLL